MRIDLHSTILGLSVGEVENSEAITLRVHGDAQWIISIVLKVVDSCWISSTEWSDTFRSFLYMERSKNHEKIYNHNRGKKFHFPKEV